MFFIVIVILLPVYYYFNSYILWKSQQVKKLLGFYGVISTSIKRVSQSNGDRIFRSFIWV